MIPVTGSASGTSVASSNRTPVDNVVANWMGQHGISVVQNRHYAQPHNDEDSLPISDAPVSAHGPDPQFWAYQGVASAELQQVSQALYDLTEIIAAERRQMKEWMSRMEGGLEKLAKSKDVGVRTSNGPSSAASSKASNADIESLVQEEFRRQRLWLGDRFTKIGSLFAQDTRGQPEVSKLEVKPEANPEAKPDPMDSAKRDSQHGMPEVLKRAMNVRHAAAARFSEANEESHLEKTTGSDLRTSYAKGSRQKLAANSGMQKLANSGMRSRDLDTERERTAKFLAKMKAAHKDRSILERAMKYFGISGGTMKHYKRKPFNFMTKIVDSFAFSTLVITTIVLNSIWMGWQITEQMEDLLDHRQVETSTFNVSVSIFFTTVYCIELIMKLLAYRAYFFFGDDFGWNMYDLFIVIAGFMDDVLEFVDMSIMRVVRVFRIFRVARLFRIFRYFEGIRYLLCSLTASTMLIFWTILFLVFVMYIFAVMFMQGFIIAHKADDSNLEMMTMAKKYYSTVPLSMLTLLMAISGGQPWENLVHPLREASPVLLSTFICFVIIVSYGILNVVNGVFVQQAQGNRAHDRDLAIQTEIHNSDMFRRQLRGIFKEKSLCDDDEMGLDLFQEVLADIDLQMFLQTQGIDTTEAHELFLLLDDDNDRLIQIDDFVYGCMRMKGTAKGMDIVILNDQVAELRKLITAMSDKQRELYRVMKITKDSISSELEFTNSLANDIFDEVRDLTKAEQGMEAQMINV